MGPSPMRRLLFFPVTSLLVVGCSALPFSSATQEYDPAAARAQYREMLRAQSAATSAAAPQRFDVKLLEGDHQLRQGDLQRAVIAYFDAARLAPDEIEPRLRLAHLEIRANPHRAERSFRALVEQAPESQATWFGLGLAKLAQSDLEGAKTALERAASHGSESPRLRATLGVVHARLGLHDEAKQYLESALELAPDDVLILTNLSISHLLAGEAERAEALLRRASQLDPQDRFTQTNLGLCVGLQGRYDEALRIFRLAADEQSALNNLAYVYLLNGDAARAVETYERAMLAEGAAGLTVLRNLRRATQILNGGSDLALR